MKGIGYDKGVFRKPREDLEWDQIQKQKKPRRKVEESSERGGDTRI